MSNLRQFALSYLFLETFWISVALACTTPYFRGDYGWELWGMAAFICWGAVAGGLFHAMRDGAIAAFLLLGAGLVVGPLVMPLFK